MTGPRPDTTDTVDPEARPEAAEFRADVIRGLQARPKTISPKYLYDERGSRLFDEICELDEYYVTRTELAIMERDAAEMARMAGPGCLVIEYGSGSSRKIGLLLDRLERPAAYVPIDISRQHLYRSADRIAARYSDLEVRPLCADFTARYELPAIHAPRQRTLVYFPGSTIGNFTPLQAQGFLEQIRRIAGAEGCALVGVDLAKPAEILEAAYDDAGGVTAEFNLNLLRRINRESGGRFKLEDFCHQIRVNEEEGRVEMHIESLRDQIVEVDGVRIRFEAGETIHTESSYKYTLDRFRAVANAAGMRVERVWTDDQRLFSVQYLVVDQE